ncbi:hypothetical protein GUJ93_ZPchr0002g23245 [Zizania palustris]|uniref:Uncharacterized protein n=1 Tax=Zizania palustris TaxID=103762 RepID=A0A8J5RS83_ZIZPA|nr:hypothetical protein GUJ93_ZPchr0002g23245 [Zizania palustris]
MKRDSESFLNCVEYDEVQDVEGSREDDDISELLRDLACGLDKDGDFEDDVESVQASDLDALRNLTNEGWADSREFASVVGTLVRKKISIACDDWRDVDIQQKLDVWTDIQLYYEIDEKGIQFAPKSAVFVLSLSLVDLPLESDGFVIVSTPLFFLVLAAEGTLDGFKSMPNYR